MDEFSWPKNTACAQIVNPDYLGKYDLFKLSKTATLIFAVGLITLITLLVVVVKYVKNSGK
jgi:hypothetical protein